MARRLAELDRIDAAELNISCPNVRHGGMAFGCLPHSAAQITQAVRTVFRNP
jgi:dihydroorotate dehydrogenase